MLVPPATVILFGTNFWDTIGFVGSVLIYHPMAIITEGDRAFLQFRL
ncbi:MAG: hypothetical protein WCF90_10025 [Methanomicrobiales archaeon]